MWYQDVSYTSEKYRGVYFTSYRPNSCGSSTSTSDSYQYNNWYDTNTVYWFKWEPIEWKELSSSDDDKFLLTEKILDSQQYYHQASVKTKRNRAPYDSTTEASVYDSNYKYSDIRGWLNTDFYNSAFSTNIQSSIKTTEVDNSASSAGDSSNDYACENTNDKVFLLSRKEATNSSYGLSSLSDRIAYATDYAKCQGAYVYGRDNLSDWWLRSPAGSSNAKVVEIDGDVYATNDTCHYGIRPALHISI